MQLGVCGFGYSGSGAVLDLLKEYNDVIVADKVELSFTFKPDGLNDLRRALCTEPTRHWSSDTAIRRFIRFMSRKRRIYNRATNGEFGNLSDDFLAQIKQVEWPGYTGTHYYQDSAFSFFFNQILALHIRVLFEKVFRPLSVNLPPQKTMYYTFMAEKEFNRKAKDFVQQVMTSITGKTEKIVAVDQLFSANRPQDSFAYFEDPKAILVLRDPRDTYLLAKRAVGIYSKFIPVDKVENFINYYRGLMLSRSYSKEDGAILEINFEDLIYQYDNTRKAIEGFLGLRQRQAECPVHFKPEVSINNTQLWKRYSGYENEVRKIEESLPEYLYHFEDHSIQPTFDTAAF